MQQPKTYRAFQEDHTAGCQAYENLGATAAEAGPLPPRIRELLKLGMSAALRAESAVQSHTHRALDAGAAQDEIEHAIMLGVTTLGFPTMMTALAWAKEAIQNHEA